MAHIHTKTTDNAINEQWRISTFLHVTQSVVGSVRCRFNKLLHTGLYKEVAHSKGTWNETATWAHWAVKNALGDRGNYFVIASKTYSADVIVAATTTVRLSTAADLT